MSDLIDPPVPSDCDLRGMPGFMLDTERLMASELWALSDGQTFKAAVGLWCRAWRQVPAASLPDDDAVLRAFAGMSAPAWKKSREMALRGFVKCSDGRLYHLVLAEDAARAWGHRQMQRQKAGKRWGSATAMPRHDHGTATANPKQSQGQGQGQGQGQIDRSKASQPAVQPSDLGWMDPSPATAPPPVVIASPAARRTTADLLAVCSAIYAPPDDRAQLDTLIALYTWDYVLAEAQDLAKGRPADKRRVFAREIGDRLAAKYDLSADDYARAGIPQPTKA